MTAAQRACQAVLHWDEEAVYSKERMVLGGGDQKSIKRHGGDRKSTRSGNDKTGDTRDILSKRFKVSHTYVQLARNLYLSNPELFNLILSGDVPNFGGTENKGVYVIRQSGTDLYKIGKSDLGPEMRLSSLQCGNPSPLAVVLWLESSEPGQLEKELHQQFAGQKVRGEWFTLTAEDLFNLNRGGECGK